MAVVGARGGAGSSTLAHNVGWCIAEELHINTTIVDLDLPFGTVGLDFNDEASQGVADALSAPERLDDVLLDRLLLKRGEHLSLFTAPAALERDYDAAPEAFEAVVDAVRQTTPCVILDLPHVWTPWIKAALIAADDIVIVATPDLASLRNAKNIVELVQSARPNDAPPRLVLNQVGVAQAAGNSGQGFRRDHGPGSRRRHRLRPGAVRPGRQQRPDADRGGAQGAGRRSAAPAGRNRHRPRAAGAASKKSVSVLLVPRRARSRA